MNIWQKRDPVKNYFMVPNEVFHLGLCSGEFIVYAYLLRCEDRKTYQCWPSYKTIGDAVGLSVNTVRKHVCALVDRGLIRTENTSVITKTGLKLNGNLRYTILPIRSVVDGRNQSRLENLTAVQAHVNTAASAEA